MKKNFKFILGIAFLFLIWGQTAEAQILQTKSEVLESYGTPFYSGTSEDGEDFLFYKIPITTENSGTYYQRRVLFFKKSADGTETCYKFKIIEPSTETPFNISSFSRNLVQVDDMQWKDYGKGIIYKMEESQGACKITAWFDNEVELARVYKF